MKAIKSIIHKYIVAGKGVTVCGRKAMVVAIKPLVDKVGLRPHLVS